MKRATMEDAYPLHWPPGQPRTMAHRRRAAPFRTTFGKARDGLLEELRRLGARYVVVSTNLPLRRDGLPYANEREPEDTGVAVYFDLDEAQHAMACDRWTRTTDNIHALAKTVEAMRGIERWGSSEIMRRAFSAFKALPPADTDWRSVLGIAGPATLGSVRDAYRRLAMENHPDRGGSDDAMARLNAAMSAAEKELAS